MAFPEEVGLCVKGYAIETMRAFKPEVRNAVPIARPPAMRPSGKMHSAKPRKAELMLCNFFLRANELPGSRCDKNNCRRFPCVCVGTDKELACRHEFNSNPIIVRFLTATAASAAGSSS